MGKWKSGRLHSGGPSGPPVKSRAQAVAIMLSDKRKEQANGGKYPERTRPVKKHSGTMPGRTR